jgi:hypothetical protein
VQEGDDQQREEHGEEGRHDRIEEVCEEGLAQSTDPQAGERDAELHRRDELRRLSGDLQHLARAA